MSMNRMKILACVCVAGTLIGTAAVASDDTLITAEFDGIVVPAREAEVTPIVSGWLKTITFKPGQFVEKGDVLFQFAPLGAELNQQLAQGQLDEAEASLRKAEADLVRAQELEKRDVVSNVGLDSATAARDIAKARMEQAKANLGTAGLGVMQMTQKAPISGIISAPMVRENGWQDVGRSGRESITMAIISQLDPIQVKGQVPYDVYANRQKVLKTDRDIIDGLELTLILPDGEAYPYKGKLVSGGYLFDEATQGIEVWVEFQNPEFFLRPGLQVKLVSAPTQK